MAGGTEMTRFGVPAGILTADMEGDRVVLNPDTGVYHLVNATGRDLFECLSSGRSLEECVERLAEQTDESRERVREDADSFVRAMLERELLVRLP